MLTPNPHNGCENYPPSGKGIKMANIILCNITPEEGYEIKEVNRLKFRTKFYEYNGKKQLDDQTEVCYMSDSKGEVTLCWIEPDNIDKFTNSFYRLLNKYAI